MNASDSLAEVITDNFDATINYQNSMKQTHALLALTFARTNCFHEDNNTYKFPPLKQQEIKIVRFLDFLEYFKWPKKVLQVVYLR